MMAVDPMLDWAPRVNVQARLPLDLAERLRRAAFERGKSQNALLVAALEKELLPVGRLGKEAR